VDQSFVQKILLHTDRVRGLLEQEIGLSQMLIMIKKIRTWKNAFAHPCPEWKS